MDACSGRRHCSEDGGAEADAGRSRAGHGRPHATLMAGDDRGAATLNEPAPPPARRRREPPCVFIPAPWAGIVALACALSATAIQIVPGTWDLSTTALVAAGVAVVLGGYALAGALMGRGRADIAGAAVLLAVASILVGIWIDRPAQLLTPT